MPRLYHPRALEDIDGHPPRTIPSAAVGARVTVDERGTFEVAEATDARPLADAYDVAVPDLVVDDSGSDADEPDSGADADGDPDADADAADLVESGVCPWCDDGDRYEGDHVGQHASSAHPDEWDAFNA